MQKLGQHFLKNKSAIQKIVNALELSKGDTIIEIGPGNGELTFPLQKACDEIGCKIIAIEKDEKLAEALKSEIQNLKIKDVEVRMGDVLEIFDSSESSSYKLVGNIPYYITGHLLRLIGEAANKPKRTVFTIQKEVAERAVAVPPKMNRLAASIQFWSEPKMLGTIPKEDFSPMPKVDSAILLLNTKKVFERAEATRYYAAMHALFAQPRKTILNNLAANNPSTMDKTTITKILENIGVDPGARPQNLDVATIVRIAGKIFKSL